MNLLWIIFWTTFLVVSTIDLFVITHRQGPVGVNSALRWTGLWVAIALAYAALIWWLHPNGRETAMLFVSGYLTEYSLSVDNLFVFILIFGIMRVGEHAQPKLIKLGIHLSIALRIVFILSGVALLHRFQWLIHLFGGVLVWTAWKMLVAEEDAQVKPEKNLLNRAARRLLPLHDPGPESRRLALRVGGRLCITPLFPVFLVIGSTDLLFALDSIPAIMGITQDPFVVLTSNIFAVLGLNSLFFALRGVVGLFKFLRHGVSVILLFIGAKMIAGAFAPVEDWFKLHSFVSLLVIGLVLGVSIILSVWHARALSSADGRESA